MKTPLIMTPGPTSVHEEFYKETCDRLKKLFLTGNDILILNGEGILGLEAACASLIESGDQVLCLDNGIFGKGFGEFAELYGAEVTYYKSDYRKAISVEALDQFLTDHYDFKLADTVFRIGHMGENCREEKLYLTLKALNDVLKNHNISLRKDLHQEFVNLIS